MADLRIQFDLRFSPAFFRVGLATLLISSLAGELSSESVTLTTYYPAPSGVYTQMITTQNTYLARDNVNVNTPSKVGIGTTNPLAKLDIKGYTSTPANPDTVDTLIGDSGCGTGYAGLSMNGVLSGCNNYSLLGDGTDLYVNMGVGNTAPGSAFMAFRWNNADQMRLTTTGLGIGTNGPANKLDVNGAASIGYPGSGAPANGMIVNGSVGIGTSAPPYKLEVIGDIRANGGWLRTTGAAGWYNDTYGGGWYMTDGTWIRNYNGKPLYENSYNEGYSFGATHAGVPMTPLADFDAAGDGVVMLREGWSVGSCWWVNYNTSGITNNICNNPNYVTTIEGVYSSYYHLGIPSGDVGGGQSQALCCSCPTGGCSF